jgi:hypothetical protein
VTVLDTFGREVAVLADAAFGEGSQVLIFDATGLAPGMYVARATAGGSVATRTMLLLRSPRVSFHGQKCQVWSSMHRHSDHAGNSGP